MEKKRTKQKNIKRILRRQKTSFFVEKARLYFIKIIYIYLNYNINIIRGTVRLVFGVILSTE